MSIFGWGGETKEQLKDKIVDLSEQLTSARDEKITAQISESRTQSDFDARQEQERAQNQIEVARLNRNIKVLKADFDEAIDYVINEKTTAMDKEFLSTKISYKKELRAEFQSELDSAKKAAKTTESAVAKFEGLYNGALLVIKALEAQLKEVNAMNGTLIEALPLVSATITTPSNSVVVGSGNES